jgi:hypothetical protein
MYFFDLYLVVGLIAIGHFMIGFSAVLFIFILVNRRNKYAFPLAFFCGIWAMIPDLVWIKSIPNYYHRIIYSLHYSNYANLFFFHRLIDLYNPDDIADDAIIYILVGFILTIIYSFRERNMRSIP